MAQANPMDKVLYPASKPFHTGTLAVDRHVLSYEEFGNPKGVPVVFIHGGPGGGCPPFAHRFFDPEFFHIIVYDQRGSGKSTPYAGISDNSPDVLVEDLKKLKDHLKIDKWHLFGGSWGSTLTLLYAEKYPEDVSSMVLRGVFMMRQKEVDWFMNDMGKFFPEARKEFIGFLPPEERGNLLESYYQRLVNPDPAIHLPAAAAWTRYETACSFLVAPPEDVKKKDTPEESLACARIEAHFFRNHMFTPDDRILKNTAAIRDIPTMIVQGRHDVVCPPESAYDLAQKLSNCSLLFTPHGHASTESGTMKALVEATNRIRDTGSPLPETKQQPPSLRRKKGPGF